MKKYRLLLIVCCCIIVLTVLLLWTQWGLQFAVDITRSLSGGTVTVGSVSGRIATEYQLGDITIATPGADIDIKSFKWAWKPFSLFKGTFEVATCSTETVTVNVKPQKNDSNERGESIALPAFVPPFHLLLHELSVRDVKIFDSAGVLAFEIDSFDTTLELVSGRLVVDRFVLDGPEVGLDFHGNVAFEDEGNLDLIGKWRLVDYGFHPSKGTFSLSGSLNSLGVNVALYDPGEIWVKGVITNLLDDATWTADVDARNVNLETWILHCPEIILKTVHGDMSGDFGHYRGLVVADGYWGVADDLQLRSHIDGDGWGIVFDSLRVDRNDSSAVATNGSISWAKLFSWKADLDVKNFVLSMFFPDFDGSISSTFHSVGDVTEQEGLVARFSLKEMQGRFGEYDWSARGNIGLTEDNVFSNDLTLMSGAINGQASVRHVEFSWLDKLSWTTVLDFDRFDPGFLHPELSGSINGRITSSLEWNEELPVGSIDIHDLTGELRGEEFFGGGTIGIDTHGMSSPGLDIRVGESRLHVMGEVKEEYGLEFSFTSPDLSNIVSDFSGSMQLEGVVKGNQDAPAIDLNITGRELHAGDIEIESIDGEMKAGLQPDDPLEGNVVVRNGSIKGYQISHFSSVAKGSVENHNLHTELQSAEGSLQFQLDGKYDEGWRGMLSKLTLETKKYGRWSQVDSARVEYSGKDGLLEDFCIASSGVGNSGDACIGLKANMADNTYWSIAADVHDFTLKAIEKMDLGLPPLTGMVDGILRATGDGDGVHSANVDITIPEAGTLLSVAEDDFVSVQLRDSKISLELQEQTLGANLFFKTTKGGTLGIEGKVNNFGLFATPLSGNTISGKLVLNKYHLSPLAALTGYGIEPTGWISSALSITGTLARPGIYGTLAIQEGGVELPYQGISLEDVVVAIESKDSGTSVRAEATSGGGKLNAKGSIAEGDEGLEASLKLTGENFLLVNLPEYSLRVTPDADIKMNKKRGQISGSVTVPSGLIAPEELSEAVKVSEDVVYLGEEQKHEIKGYPFYLDLDVLLGDDVKVDGYGLEGRLGGQLNVKATPTDFITGRGELDFRDSTFTLYGRSLKIERGRMLFTGGPLDNPGVDIRAQKTVTAKTARDDGYTVGVDINGFVQDLQFHLFSDPYMDDTDILSQMVVGRSFASSSEEEGTLLQAAALTLGLKGSSKLMKGLGDLLLIDDLHLEGSTRKEDVSLVVGKRITKKLYIGYDMNMFSQFEQFRVRYDLSRGFYVETRSSTESAGADLIYTFER